MFANVYQQIIFSITIRAFTDVSIIDNIVRDIDKLIFRLREMTQKGRIVKGGGEKTQFRIYLNEFGNYMNMVLYSRENDVATFLGFDIPQYLVSYNLQVYDYSKEWVDKIRKRSVLISTDGYQYRELFFLKLENDFTLFKERVKKLTEVYYT